MFAQFCFHYKDPIHEMVIDVMLIKCKAYSTENKTYQYLTYSSEPETIFNAIIAHTSSDHHWKLEPWITNSVNERQ
jgi:hypothetical protein